ncbi:YsnF/AvaK domain-containing protein [Domibacillus robiginosus]|uniref:YsnF/AvaK domain-containing protein n=1 Tax=Domibacillus robiginosus TaxID=1071054 RepID=UPI00067C26DB|nr:YsnF/AvaK domain-containing protein [Domibacillus robiginosus]
MENKNFIGVYHNETDLLAKIDELKANGYSEQDMYITVKDKDAVSMVRGRTDAEIETAGGSWGDRFMSFLSGVDPIRESFRNMGLSDAESDRYYSEIENGGMLLYVDRDYGERYGSSYDPSSTVGLANGNRADLDGENLEPIDYDRLDSTRNDRTTTGLTDTNLGGNATFDTDRTVDDSLSEEEKLRLHEERLNVSKERVQTGEVHVEKEVIEEEQVVDVPVEREEVFVERRPVTDDAGTRFGDRDRAFEEDGETIRVPVTEERVQVTKKPVVTEEIVVGKRKVEDTETVRDTVRREEAHIDEDDNERLRKDRDRDLF